jgi:hypothetical protein
MQIGCSPLPREARVHARAGDFGEQLRQPKEKYCVAPLRPPVSAASGRLPEIAEMFHYTAVATLAAQRPRIGNYLIHLLFNPRAELSDKLLK